MLAGEVGDGGGGSDLVSLIHVVVLEVEGLVDGARKRTMKSKDSSALLTCSSCGRGRRLESSRQSWVHGHQCHHDLAIILARQRCQQGAPGQERERKEQKGVRGSLCVGWHLDRHRRLGRCFGEELHEDGDKIERGFGCV